MSVTWFRLILILGLILLGLHGCGGASSAAQVQATVPKENIFFPVGVGDRWVYVDELGNIETREVKSAQIVDGAFHARIEIENRSGVTEKTFRVAETSVYELAGPQASAQRRAIGPMQRIIVADSRLASSTQIASDVASGLDIDSDGKMDVATVESTLTAFKTETFFYLSGNARISSWKVSNKINVNTLKSSVTPVAFEFGNIQNESFDESQWYAPGIGIVRDVQDAGVNAAKITKNLVAYRVGYRSNLASMAKTIPETVNKLGQRSASQTKLRLRFLEALDINSPSAGAIQVRDSAGQPVNGSLSYDPIGQLIFSPTTPWKEGEQLSARTLDGLKARDGRPIAAEEVKFVVDTEGPVIASFNPLDQVDVKKTTEILIKFSEDIDPNSVMDGYDTAEAAFSVEYFGSSVYAGVAFDGTVVGGPGPQSRFDHYIYNIEVPEIIDARTVRLKLKDGLLYEGQYKVIVRPQVTDTFGNRLIQEKSWSFSIEKGLFEEAKDVLGFNISATSKYAFGDFNGDGLSDIVWVQADVPKSASLHLSLQILGGGFTPPVSYVLAVPSTCDGQYLQTGPIATGDWNGDSKTDFFLTFTKQLGGTGTCGTQTFTLSASGAIQLTETIGTQATDRAAWGDIDGDGRSELVGINYGATEISLTRFDSHGRIASFQTSPFFKSVSYIEQFLLVDINNDGLLDIVVNFFSELYYAQGLPSGGFLEPRRISGASEVIGAAFVADINGDGLKDLVFNQSQIAGRTIKVMYGVTAGFASIPVTLINSIEKYLWGVADFDNNGLPDLILGTNPGLTRRPSFEVQLQKSRGQFESLDYYGSSGIFVDLNGDGFLDMFDGEADQRGLLARLSRARLFN
jgi:hypothetical protein